MASRLTLRYSLLKKARVAPKALRVRSRRTSVLLLMTALACIEAGTPKSSKQQTAWANTTIPTIFFQHVIFETAVGSWSSSSTVVKIYPLHPAWVTGLFLLVAGSTQMQRGSLPRSHCPMFSRGCRCLHQLPSSIHGERTLLLRFTSQTSSSCSCGAYRITWIILIVPYCMAVDSLWTEMLILSEWRPVPWSYYAIHGTCDMSPNSDTNFCVRNDRLWAENVHQWKRAKSAWKLICCYSSNDKLCPQSMKLYMNRISVIFHETKLEVLHVVFL